MNNKKVLLVYPAYPDTFWSFKHVLKYIKKKAAFPPLGLLTVAAMLPKAWEKRLVDVNVECLKEADIEWADMVFVSAMLIQSKSAQEIIAVCKSKDKIVVAGGPAFTSSSEKFSGVDYFVLNEAEITLPEFFKDLEEGKAKSIYTSTKKPSLFSSPVPDWSLVDFKNYATVAIQYSRGCPHNCEFCDITATYGRVQRTKTVDQVIKELNLLLLRGWKGSVFFTDDNFIGNRQKVKKELLPALIEWQIKNNYPFKFFTEASVLLAEDEELMDLMRQANFNKVFLGLETPNLESLKECDKTQNTKVDLVEAVKKIHSYGMQVMAGFIVGFDNDPSNIFDTQIKFIQKIGVVTAMVGLLNALPKTRLWDRLSSEQRLVNDASGENTDGTLNFIPAMDKKKLLEGYKEILSTIYSRKYYYKRINQFIKDFNPGIKERLLKEDVRAFIMSIWKIGIFSRSSPRYWHLIIKTLITKSKAFPIAVELAIHGQHFIKNAKIISRRISSEISS